MKRLKQLGIVALVVVILIVVLQNTQQVETELLWVSVTMPRALLLLITLLVGFALGVLVAGRIKKKGPGRA